MNSHDLPFLSNVMGLFFNDDGLIESGFLKNFIKLNISLLNLYYSK